MSTIRPLATIAILAALGVFLAQQIKEPKEGDLVANAGANPEHYPAPAAAVAPPFDPTAAPPALEAPLASAPADATPELPTLPGLPASSPPAPAMPPLPPMPALPPMGAPVAASAPPVTNSAPPLGVLPPGLPPAQQQSAPQPPLGEQEIPMPDSVATADYSGAEDGDTPLLPDVPAMPAAPEAPLYGQPTSDPYAGYAPTEGPEMAPLAAPQATTSPIEPNDTSASYQSLGDLPAQAGASFDQTLPVIYQALERDELSRAHAMLSTWYREPSLTAQQSAKVNELLSQLAGTVVYSTEHRLEPPYTVQPGETLESIAAKHNVPWRLLAKINGVRTADAVQPGQTLKVMRGPFAAVVDATNNELVLLIDGKYAGKFPVQLSGAAQQEGQWKVAEKPTPQPPALPGMPASEKQLVLKDDLGAATIVISGGGGSPLERGRVSVAGRDLDELHDILSVGSQVVIKR